MLTVAEALAAVRAEAVCLPPRLVPLAEALGLTLAADVAADLDLPPFDKSLVDGYAVRSADLLGATGPIGLRVVDEIFAGRMPSRPVGAGEAALIMTGAPLPSGADAVVMVERVERPGPGVVLVPGPANPGQNRIVRGREMKAGEVVVPRGTLLGPARLGVLASVGAALVSVIPRPVVVVASTGDELVPIDRVPGPGQIRNSNTTLLASLARDQGADARPLPITPDRPEALVDSFRLGLEADVLLVSGGVSAGQKDLVPDAFEAVGIRRVFHKVRLKPGKPLWFGVGPVRDGRPPTLVFGLPGNPVSGLACFLLFVRPALAILSGSGPDVGPLAFPLSRPYRHADDRDTYRPARLVGSPSRVDPIDSGGSSDLRSAALADGFAIFPAGERMYSEGEPVGFLPARPSRPGPVAT